MIQLFNHDMQLEFKLCAPGIYTVNVVGKMEPVNGLIQLRLCLKHIMHIPYDCNKYNFLQKLMVTKSVKKLSHFNANHMLTTTITTANHWTLTCDSVILSRHTNTLFIQGAF